ncbi:MAG: hypothetical protein HY812_00495 [Planctomycetes bacterium]|nr:hypothetical protein [Planctomycetota bacterium]
MALSTLWLGMRAVTAAQVLGAMREIELRQCALSRFTSLRDPERLLPTLRPAGARVVALEAGMPGGAGPGGEPALVSPEAVTSGRALEEVARAAALAKAAGARHVALRLGDLDLKRAREREDELWAKVRTEGVSEALQGEAAAIARLADRQSDSYIDRACRLLFAACRAEPDVRFAIATPASLAGFPNQRVLALILGEVPLCNLGYWHDSGAAWRLEVLGVSPAGSWAGEHSERTFGAALSDAAGAETNLPPGAGALDFRQLAESLPSGVPLVLEVDSRYSAAEVKLAVSYLHSAGM